MPSELAALEPDLAGRFGTGLYFADEAHLDPRAALRLAGAPAGAPGGPDPLRRRAAYPLDPGPVIDCRGLAARDALPDLRGVKGEMLWSAAAT